MADEKKTDPVDEKKGDQNADANKESKGAAARLIKVTVRGPKGRSRWRAGIQFGEQPIEVEVTKDQLAAIKGDPELMIIPASK